ITNSALPIITADLADSAKARVVKDAIIVEYDPLTDGGAYVGPRVKLEFGARSTGEPCITSEIACDAAKSLVQLGFPTTVARVMAIERTFWEKATAVHVFCAQRKLKGEKLARHWYDLARLDEHGYADKALADRNLGCEVAEHKQLFFRAKDFENKVIDYKD